VSASVKH